MMTQKAVLAAFRDTEALLEAVEIIGSGFDSYTIRNIVGPEKFARRIMAQATAVKKRYY